VSPAYEDPGEWILKEGNLPDNVTPDNSKLKDPRSAHRIATVFAAGLTTPSGFVLPVQRWQAKAAGPGWRSEKWKTRRGHVFLVPGDSPVGYRLPLGSLPYVPASQYPLSIHADPTEPRGAAGSGRKALDDALAGRVAMPRRRRGPFTARRPRRCSNGSSRSSENSEARCARRSRSNRATAGCVSSCRRSSELEDYLELVAAAEKTADGLACPFTSRATRPPHDPRLNVIRVAPDPGRDRGQHPSRAQLGRMQGDHRRRL
jgi:uncharacterized protein (DUF2126 family)